MLFRSAVMTAHLALNELGAVWLPVQRSWRLNERHYGALQGLDKKETAARHGEAQTKLWRRSYDTPPPALTAEDARYEARDPRYRGVPVPKNYTSLGITRAMTQALARHRATDTFAFSNTAPAEDDPELLRVFDHWCDAGHHVANHTHHHASINWVDGRAHV